MTRACPRPGASSTVIASRPGMAPLAERRRVARESTPPAPKPAMERSRPRPPTRNSVCWEHSVCVTHTNSLRNTREDKRHVEVCALGGSPTQLGAGSRGHDLQRYRADYRRKTAAIGLQPPGLVVQQPHEQHNDPCMAESGIHDGERGHGGPHAGVPQIPRRTRRRPNPAVGRFGMRWRPPQPPRSRPSLSSSVHSRAP